MPPRRRKRVVDEDDSDGDTAYPSGLLSAVAEQDWESPKKVTKHTVRAPFKRREHHKRKQVEKRADKQATAFEIGPIDDWGPPDGFGEFGSPGPSDGVLDTPPLPTVLTSAPVFSEEDISSYGDAVEDFTSHFTCIEDRLFVVEGWDTQRKKCTVRLCFTHKSRHIAELSSQLGWYHLQYLWIDEELHTTCTCPQGINDLHCIHQAFFKSFETESLLRAMAPVSGREGMFTCDLAPMLRPLSFASRSPSSSHVSPPEISRYILFCNHVLRQEPVCITAQGTSNCLSPWLDPLVWDLEMLQGLFNSCVCSCSGGKAGIDGQYW